MTEEKFIEAKHLQERIKNLQYMIAFAGNKETKFFLGMCPDRTYSPNTYNTLESQFFYGEDIKEEYDRIKENARKELVKFLSSKLDKLKKEFENV